MVRANNWGFHACSVLLNIFPLSFLSGAEDWTQSLLTVLHAQPLEETGSHWVAKLPWPGLYPRSFGLYLPEYCVYRVSPLGPANMTTFYISLGFHFNGFSQLWIEKLEDGWGIASVLNKYGLSFTNSHFLNATVWYLHEAEMVYRIWEDAQRVHVWTLHHFIWGTWTSADLGLEATVLEPVTWELYITTLSA